MILDDLRSLQQYCCNSTVATVPLQQSVATVLLQQVVTTVLLQQYCCNSIVVIVLRLVRLQPGMRFQLPGRHPKHQFLKIQMLSSWDSEKLAKAFPDQNTLPVILLLIIFRKGFFEHLARGRIMAMLFVTTGKILNKQYQI